ncbi:MAG: GGDEF domain-containing protein [Nocardioides sp.]
MPLLTWMQPRDVHAGRRVVSAFSATALVVTLVFLPLIPDSGERTHVGLVIAAAMSLVVVAVLAVLAWLFLMASRVAWALSPFLAIAAIVLADLATHDFTVSAMVFFLFPTLYGASLLPRPGAVLVTAASILGAGIVVAGSPLPLEQAVVQGGYMAAALTATATMLSRSGERQAALMGALERRAETDPLTGLVTRWVFDAAMENAVINDIAAEGTSLILLDVDRFKAINDEFGHPGGDEILVQLAHLLARKSRGTDVVCRLGGDEVALLLPGCSKEVGRRRAEELVAEVRWHRFTLVDGSIVNVSVSAGLAHSPTHAVTAAGLYAAADSALSAAKLAGRDRLVELPASTGPDPVPRRGRVSSRAAPR